MPATTTDRVDPSLATRGEEGVLWYDLRHLDVEGRGWEDTASYYDRLPARAEGVVRQPVWNLSRHSAGIGVRFVSDAETIRVRWTLRFEPLAMPHMAASGVSGIDLYTRETNGGGWRWSGNARPSKFPNNEDVLAQGVPAGSREHRLYLPLYNGVESVEIGIGPEATLAKAPPYPLDDPRPIVCYGTSITQGACASRPGMAYPAQLGRQLGRPTINLGFSGNGKAEPEMASLLAELDPVLYLINPVPNLSSAEEVTQRIGPLVETLRGAHPQTPIVLVGPRPMTGYGNPARRVEEAAKNRNLRAVHETLVGGGMQGVHLIDGDGLVGDDGEATVDGSHPTDLGLCRMTRTFVPVLRRLLDAGATDDAASSAGPGE